MRWGRRNYKYIKKEGDLPEIEEIILDFHLLNS